MGYYMGIDLGTSSVKTMIMEESGVILGVAKKSYPIIKPGPEFAEQDMDVLWDAVRETIRELMKKHHGINRQICAVGYSGQMHGLVMLDRDGQPIRNAIIWADQRSKEEVRKIYGMIPKDEYNSITLNALTTGFLSASLMWVKENEPYNYEKISRVLLPKDYIRYKMCKELGTDMSDASSTVIFDTAGRTWAWELIDRLGFEREFFVPCHESYELAGEVTARCCEETGLVAGTKVVYGGGDSLMQAVGNGMTGPGILSANIGTASQLACIMKKPFYDRRFRTNTFCHVREDMWMLMGANLSGGVALEWLRTNILGIPDFNKLTQLAGEAPAGSGGLLFLPYLSGERTPYQDPDAKGIYFGMTLKTDRSHLIRSTMEGIVFALKNSLEIFAEMGVEIQKITASGGGARGTLFRQIQADIFGREVYTSLAEEQACTGAAITAAVGVGAYASLEEACGRIVRFDSEPTAVNRENARIYEERYEVFKELYPRNKELFA